MDHGLELFLVTFIEGIEVIQNLKSTKKAMNNEHRHTLATDEAACWQLKMGCVV